MKDLSMHILDIAQNSIRAKASQICIEIEEKPDADQFIIRIDDDGCGMDAEELAKAIDPFYTSRTTRKVGLGLSLLKQNTENTGGSFSIHSEKNKGTQLTAAFSFSHIDRPVLGDIVGTLMILFSSSGEINFEYRHKTPSGEFSVNTSEINEMLDGIPIRTPEVRKFLTDYLSANLEQVQISE
ncbi:MAG: sensor histidine kinase [Prolixibacteraceae bacterium]|jgi:hypothetical protein|nr:sensor histidine kinase [Prolixibacteraceae bacterium]